MSFFEYYALLLFFFKSGLAQDVAKNNPTKKNLMQKFRQH